MKINISEIFYSIQGEGYSVGIPTVFVRLQGCNLRCEWCDTYYAQDNHGKLMEIDLVVDKVLEYANHTNICITGGEPLRQSNSVFRLLTKLNKIESIKSIIIQTNGSYAIDKFFIPKVTIAMDYKLPSSKVENSMLNQNLILLRKCDEMKFVIKDKNDFEKALELLNDCNIKAKIVFSPVFPDMKYEYLAQMILEAEMHCKLSIQLHRHIWPDVERGI